MFLRFRDIEIVKGKFYSYKSLLPLKDVDIDKVLVSSKISFCEKKTISPLLITCIMNVKLSQYM